MKKTRTYSVRTLAINGGDIFYITLESEIEDYEYLEYTKLL